MKYIFCAVPLVLCIELVSYICLCIIATMFMWDLCKAMDGKW